MNEQVVLGIDIGGTNTVYGLITKDGNVIHHESIPTNGSLPIADLLNRLNSKVNEALSSYPEIKKIIGVGIGAPNGNHFTGMIQNPPNLSWGNVDVNTLFSKTFECEVDLTNDANAAALGEKHFGIAKDMEDFVVITLGTGLGSGIFCGGRLLYGHDGFAGEMGHICIEVDGRLCNCGNKGCLEAYASAGGIKKTIKNLLLEYPDSEFLKSLDGDKVDITDGDLDRCIALVEPFVLDIHAKYVAQKS